MCRYSIRFTCVLIVVVMMGLVTSGISAQHDWSGTDLRERARQAFNEGRYADADRDLRVALADFEEAGSRLDIAETLGDMTSVLIALERYSQAEPLLDRALTIMPEKTGAHAPLTARLLGNLGAVYAQTGRDSDAASAFQRAIGLLEQYANDDPHIVILLSNLGVVHVKNGKYKQAER
jgi:tetratricopeptide (TPR) repeat protein